MKSDKISESGIIGPNGQLRMPMDRLNAFFADHKGERVVVRFEAAAPGSTALQLAYYYNYIVPTITVALLETGQRMTDEWTDRYLIQEYPGEFRTQDGQLVLYGRQLTKTQMSEFLEWLKQFAAENLYVYIEDPKTL